MKHILINLHALQILINFQILFFHFSLIFFYLTKIVDSILNSYDFCCIGLQTGDVSKSKRLQEIPVSSEDHN